MTPGELAALLDRHRDGRIDAEAAARLAAALRDTTTADAVIAARTLEAELAALCAPRPGLGRTIVARLAAEDEAPAFRRAFAHRRARESARIQRRRRRHLVIWPVLAAAAAAVLLLWWRTDTGPGLGRLTTAGVVEHGGRPATAPAGSPLRSGDVVTGPAELVLARARLRLATDARLVVGDAERVGLLRRGTCDAEVEPRRPGEVPFALGTPEATVRVVGTAFTLAAGDGRTELAVRSGVVELAAAGGAVRVAAGGHAVAQGGTARALPDPGPVRDGLLAWWPCDEGAGASADDATGRGGGLSIDGGTWTAGRTGGGVSFRIEQDRYNSASAPHDPHLAPPRWTLSLWVRIARPLSAMPGTWHAIAAYEDWDRRQGFVLGDNLDATRLCARVIDGKREDERYREVLVPLPEPGRWHHLAVTWDGARLRVWRDGAECTRDNGYPPAGMRFPDGRHWIFAPAFDGDLDEIRLYDRPLGEREIRLLADAPGGP